MDTAATRQALVGLRNAAATLAQLRSLAAERPPLEAASAGSGPVADTFRNEYNRIAGVVDPLETEAQRMMEAFAQAGEAIVAKYEEVDAQAAQAVNNVPRMV